MKLHELLKTALERYESLKDDPKVKFNLNQYYNKHEEYDEDDKVIEMCLAGGYAHFEQEKYRLFIKYEWPSKDFGDNQYYYDDLYILSYLSRGDFEDSCEIMEYLTEEEISDIEKEIPELRDITHETKVDDTWFAIMWKLQKNLAGRNK